MKMYDLVEVVKYSIGRIVDLVWLVEGDFFVFVVIVLRFRFDLMIVSSLFLIIVLWGCYGFDFVFVFVFVKKCIKRNCFLMSRFFFFYVYD